MHLKAKGSAYSVERALEALETVQWHQVEINGEAHTGVSVTPEQRALFQELEVEPPRQSKAG